MYIKEWLNMLDIAEQVGFLSRTHQIMACNWETCAIGEAIKNGAKIALNDKNVRLREGEPANFELRCMGARFSKLVLEKNYVGAKTEIGCIEEKLSEMEKHA